MNDLKIRAFHEAGHAVVAWAYRWLEDSHQASLASDLPDSWLDICRERNPIASESWASQYPDPEVLRGKSEEEREELIERLNGKRALRREEAERVAILAFASLKAEQEIGTPPPWGCEEDVRIAIEIVDALIETRGESIWGSLERESYLEWLQTRATLLLKHHWREVEQVAELLLVRGTVSGKDIRSVLPKVC